MKIELKQKEKKFIQISQVGKSSTFPPSRKAIYTLLYLTNLQKFTELHGDRQIKDDKAIVGGIGQIDQQTFVIIGHQKVQPQNSEATAILGWQIQKVIVKL